MKSLLIGAMRWYISLVQKIVVSVSLFLLYAVGFGVMAILVQVVRYKSPAQRSNGIGFWRKAEGYDDLLAGCLRGS
ncbi:MAG: hypothetical protein NTU66_06215 [Elusimicrobia bacterium]|nr:hypothetical protein [Elusimicrobiota bacterium]